MNTIMAIDTDKTVSALTAGSVNSADKAGEGFGNTAKYARAKHIRYQEWKGRPARPKNMQRGGGQNAGQAGNFEKGQQNNNNVERGGERGPENGERGGGERGGGGGQQNDRGGGGGEHGRE